MKNYIQKLRHYVHENTIVFEENCPQPCLDALWWHYSEYHNLESEAAREGFGSLRTQFESLPFRVSDNIFSEIGCLCAEYERLAFTAGLRLGVQLMLELQDA